MKFKSIGKLFGTGIILIILSGCGGGGGSSPIDSVITDPIAPTDPTTPTGKVIDGPVQGLNYICSSGSTGITNINGEYTCKEGDTVEFTVGSVPLGTVTTKDEITTPYSFFANEVDPAINVARLLQSIDSDGIYGGDIIINQDLASLLPSDLDFTSPTFENDVETALNITLVSAMAAQIEMNGAILNAGGTIPVPYINHVTDSLGNVQTNSFAVEGHGQWPEGIVTPMVVNVGDVITFTVDATEPEGGTLEYKFVTPSGTTQDWSTSNTFTWTVGASDFGPMKIVYIAVRNTDGRDYMGEWNGDDYTYATYDVSD